MKKRIDGRSISFISPFVYPLLFPEISGNCGGAERQFFLFGRYLAELGWRVSFITSRPPFSIDLPPSFAIHFADFSYLGGSKLRMPKDWGTLWSAMDRADADFYVLKVPVHLLALMSIFTKLKKHKLIFWSQMSWDANPSERTGMNRIANFLQDWGIKRADLVIAQSEEQKKNFIKNYGIDAKVVPSISDRIIDTTQTDIYNVKPVDILWVGNSSPKKRFEALFELARLLPHRSFAVGMNMSDARRYAEAEQTARRLTNVLFLGTLSPVEMESWFARTRLFLNTSTLEGFPNTFLQSWMNRVPVVALNIDPDGVIQRYGIGKVAGREAVDKCNGKFHLMARLLIPLVEGLLENKAFITDMGDKALDFVERHHVPSVVGPLLLSLLERNAGSERS